MNESFPTHLRGTATGGAYNIGRVGAMLAPLVIGIIADNFSIGLGLSVLGIAYALAALVPFFARPAAASRRAAKRGPETILSCSRPSKTTAFSAPAGARPPTTRPSG